MDGWLGSEVEGTDETLDSLSDEMMCANKEEIFSGRRAGMVTFFSFKVLWKVDELFLEDEKIVLALKNIFEVISLFYA